MQPQWLRQYFHQHDAADGHSETDEPVEGPSEDGVSRRDFVKASVVAGVAAGAAAGAVIAQTAGPAEAQAPNPMGRNWWPSPSRHTGVPPSWLPHASARCRATCT